VRSLQPHSSDRMTVVWEAAPACSSVPTAANTIADKFGRLWSWEDGTTCAFKVRQTVGCCCCDPTLLVTPR
jgi:hypothetical protein